MIIFKGMQVSACGAERPNPGQVKPNTCTLQLAFTVIVSIRAQGFRWRLMTASSVPWTIDLTGTVPDVVPFRYMAQEELKSDVLSR